MTDCVTEGVTDWMIDQLIMIERLPATACLTDLLTIWQADKQTDRQIPV